MAYIKIIEHEESTGELKGIYDYLVSTRGKLADVHKIQSLNPPTVLSHMNLYKDIMFGQSPLKRYQREMIGVVVSSVNQCEYCVKHHCEALNHYWKDDARIDLLIAQENTHLSEEDSALCEFARDVTRQPELTTQQKINKLRSSGFDDRAVLDATLVISYFNFVNRIVLAMGLESHQAETSGYNY
ncbi:MAG: peroxidase-related enzyme [Cyclobacteriaceae bacterium]|nr:peroxidase-related enzyme [Cyclobacteriaceae bacterium]